MKLFTWQPRNRERYYCNDKLTFRNAKVTLTLPMHYSVQLYPINIVAIAAVKKEFYAPEIVMRRMQNNLALEAKTGS